MLTLRLFTLLLCILPLRGVLAQEYLNRDSLWKEVRTSAADTNRVLLYIQLGQQYENNTPDSALWLYEQALQLSKQLKYTPGIIKYYTNATYVYNVLGRYDTSLFLNLKAVEIARAYGNKERLAACLANVGSSYLYLKDYEQSINFTLQALAVYKAINSIPQLSSLSSNLSILYREIGQVDKALDVGLDGLNYARKSESTYHTAIALSNLGPVYNELNRPDDAIKVLNEAIDLSVQSENLWTELNADLNMVDAYILKSMYSEMKPYLDNALRLSKIVEDQESIVITFRGYSIYYLYTGKVAEAKKYGEASLRAANENEYTFHAVKAMEQLVKIELALGNYSASERYSRLSDSLRSDLFNERIAKNIQVLEARFNSRQQQDQIVELEQDAQRNKVYLTTLILAFISVVTVILLSYRTYSQRKKIHDRDSLLQQSRIDQLEKEKQLLASEAIIRGQEEERTRMAKDLHDGLGGMLSGVKFSLTNIKTNSVLDAGSVLVFERTMDMLDQSIQELRRVAHNMMPEVLINYGLTEALRGFCESIEQTKLLHVEFNSIGLSERLPREIEIQCFRIVQELLNNVLRHAKATEVVVQLSRHEEQFFITVEDNGIGFDQDQLGDRTSAGLANIRNRLDFLNGKMEIHSTGESGTSVEISISVP